MSSTGLSSNPDGIIAKDRQILVGPAPDSNPAAGGGAPVAPPGEDSDTLGAITPTKGRLAVGNGSAWTFLAVGTNGYVLIADSTQTVGMRWGPVVVPDEPEAESFDERDLWLYGDADPEIEDLTDIRPDVWLFGDL